jgi:hypothetical protein
VAVGAVKETVVELRITGIPAGAVRDTRLCSVGNSSSGDDDRRTGDQGVPEPGRRRSVRAEWSEVRHSVTA